MNATNAVKLKGFGSEIGSQDNAKSRLFELDLVSGLMAVAAFSSALAAIAYVSLNFFG